MLNPLRGLGHTVRFANPHKLEKNLFQNNFPDRQHYYYYYCSFFLLLLLLVEVLVLLVSVLVSQHYILNNPNIGTIRQRVPLETVV